MPTAPHREAELVEGRSAERRPVLASGRVVSDTRGRVRVRVHAAARHPATMAVLNDRLEERLGAGKVEVTPSTGSVLVHYDAQRHSSLDVLQVIKDVGVIVEDTFRGLGEEAPETSGTSTTGDSVVQAVADLDRQLSVMTGRRVDLKLLFPLALGGVGVWRAMSSGLGIGEVPAYVLLWYAFDSFWKFHNTSRTTPPLQGDAQPE